MDVREGRSAAPRMEHRPRRDLLANLAFRNYHSCLEAPEVRSAPPQPHGGSLVSRGYCCIGRGRRAEARQARTVQEARSGLDRVAELINGVRESAVDVRLAHRDVVHLAAIQLPSKQLEGSAHQSQCQSVPADWFSGKRKEVRPWYIAWPYSFVLSGQ
jgi:hypothetical protein